MTRRTLFQAGLAGAASVASGRADLRSREIAVFTDHLAGFSYEEVARMFRDLKVAGPDLTVRSGGLVKPERVRDDLPRAVAVFREHGLKVPMITTEILRPDEVSRAVLETAAKLGIGYYRLGYPRYKDVTRYQESIATAREGWSGLAELGRQLNIRAAVHNHGGDAVGCVVWDALQAMQGLDQDRLGIQFDPAHASIEGAKMGWQLQLQLAKPQCLSLR
ncbi:MAG: TIM barrel protein [Bryobacteraceae bacterium]